MYVIIGTVDIFRGSYMSLLLWSQILSWLEAPLPKVNSFLAKTKKTLKTGYRDVTFNYWISCNYPCLFHYVNAHNMLV